MLDGSGTTGETATSTFFWEQVAGPSTLRMLGHDRKEALLFDTSEPGTYRFRLTASNGNQTDTDECVLTVSAITANVIYVDGGLATSITDGTYSIENRDSSGSDGNAYKTPQEAADVVTPGVTVKIRGGQYVNALAANAVYLSVLNLSTDGLPTAPIRFEAFADEDAIFVGLGYEDADLDGDLRADGPAYPKKRETVIGIDGDYVQLHRLRVRNSQGSGMTIRGSYCSVTECVAHDNWENGFLIESEGEDLRGTVLHSSEAFRNRHISGCLFKIDKSAPAFLTNCAIVEGLFHRNGFDEEGNKVLPINWDPAGGGNSDGIAAGKDIFDAAINNPQVDNYGKNNFLTSNLCFNNADDGIDTCFADSVIEDNISGYSGPEGRKGFKMLRIVSGMVYRGNVALQNQGVGFELRAEGALTVLHNTSIGNARQGILGGSDDGFYLGNLCTFNSLNDFIPDPATLKPGNWAEDGTNVEPDLRGDPEITNQNVANLEVVFDPNVLVSVRWRQLRDYYRSALTPAADSPLIDRGTVIAGYHCPRADDDPVNPMPADAPGRHWFGSAPDLGAFEFTPKPRPKKPTGLRAIPSS